MYKVTVEGNDISIDNVYYNKQQDTFAFIVPALKSIYFQEDFILVYRDIMRDESTIEHCSVIDKAFANNKCKVFFKINSKGARYLQDAIANNDRMVL